MTNDAGVEPFAVHASRIRYLNLMV